MMQRRREGGIFGFGILKGGLFGSGLEDWARKQNLNIELVSRIYRKVQECPEGIEARTIALEIVEDEGKVTRILEKLAIAGWITCEWRLAEHVRPEPVEYRVFIPKPWQGGKLPPPPSTPDARHIW